MNKCKKFTTYEASLINNLNITSVDEAFTLIPSLKDKFPKSEELAMVLNQLRDYQKEEDNIPMYSAMASYETNENTNVNNMNILMTSPLSSTDSPNMNSSVVNASPMIVSPNNTGIIDDGNSVDVHSPIFGNSLNVQNYSPVSQ